MPLDQLATPTAGLFPEFEHFEVFAGQRPDDAYSSLLEAFEREAMLDSSYFFCKQDSVVAAAQLLGEVNGARVCFVCVTLLEVVHERVCVCLCATQSERVSPVVVPRPRLPASRRHASRQQPALLHQWLHQHPMLSPCCLVLTLPC